MTTYFLEIKTGEGNTAIGAFLSDHHVTDEAWSKDQLGSDGKRHNVCEIPSFHVLKLAQTIERQDSRVRFGYWLRQTSRGILRPADFLLEPRKIRRTKKYKDAKKRQKELSAERVKTNG